MGLTMTQKLKLHGVPNSAVLLGFNTVRLSWTFSGAGVALQRLYLLGIAKMVNRTGLGGG